jgi:hypothetical protein
VQKQLPAPKADPARVAQLVGGIKRNEQRDLRDWARALRAREQRGDQLSIAQREAWREALRFDQGGEAA